MKLKKTSKTKQTQVNRSISVIIPTYNSWSTLEACLESILKQTLKPLEIIVVDNASTDNTVDQVTKFIKLNKRVRLIRNKRNLGVTGGRNVGIKSARTKSDYLFFFDHDMVADPRMLEELVIVAESDEKIGILTPKIYYWEDRKRIWAAGTGINLWNGYVIFRGGVDIGQYNRVEEVQVAPAAMLVKRDVIIKIKGFDDVYFATYEDTDFCFRARRKGYITMYEPEAIAYHKIPLGIADSNKRLLNRAYLIGRNRVIFMKRFGKSMPLFLLFIPIFGVYYFLLSLKYGKPFAGLDFVKGTISGLLIR